jgi:tRNA uridine 5-carboxymethylaminomethyl modification enzyme
LSLGREPFECSTWNIEIYENAICSTWNMQTDVLIIGGGHAGAEAARVASRAGCRVVLLTMDRAAIGRMSCNPAIGGLAKGHLVKELDALGGLMPTAADASGIQFKVLNRSKGPAVQGPRAQCDRDLYPAAVQRLLASESGVTILEGSAAALSIRAGSVCGALLADGSSIDASATVITSGTFLRGLMHFGEKKLEGGRFGEQSATSLSDSLRELGLRLGRLKTGTPPRIHRDSIRLDVLEPQPGDPTPRLFSVESSAPVLPQILCWLTHTTAETHESIRRNLHRAPMFSGQIEGTGPRYCPSIEDKVVRFADKERHHVFVEPEGLSTDWMYLNGVSTSLPEDVQEAVVRSLPGFENARIARFGYAVEYDYANPQQLLPTLQVRGVHGLFLAGQINGTSGYEEAAAQGFVAGLNAARAVKGAPPVIFSRDSSYIGVLIDDLVTLGTEEPYRMFTSRAEHRLLLGCDSVYDRLTPLAVELGILSDSRRAAAEARIERMRRAQSGAHEAVLTPDASGQAWARDVGFPIGSPTTFAGLLTRNDITLERILTTEPDNRLKPIVQTFLELSEEEREGVVSRIRYAGYLEKQARETERSKRDDHVGIPERFSFERPGLSREVQEKLSRIRPYSLGQAARIPGVTPAAISLIRMYLRQEQG